MALARCTLWASDRSTMSFTRVDFPEPDTPVTATSEPSGKSTSTSSRLCSRAPSTRSTPLPGRRTAGTGIFRVPDRYCPVSEAVLATRPSTGPEWTIWPPCSPAPGPTSTTWSAIRMVSSSCSTTMTVLPRSRRRSKVVIRRLLSRWCRPMDGSSST